MRVAVLAYTCMGTIGALAAEHTIGIPGAVRFMVPTIADGKVFPGVGAQGYVPGRRQLSGTHNHRAAIAMDLSWG